MDPKKGFEKKGTVKIRCESCGRVIEIEKEKAKREEFHNLKCPFCHRYVFATLNIEMKRRILSGEKIIVQLECEECGNIFEIEKGEVEKTGYEYCPDCGGYAFVWPVSELQILERYETRKESFIEWLLKVSWGHPGIPSV